MLKTQDCRPGVEVVCIKNLSQNVQLEIGCIYTINRYSSLIVYKGNIAFKENISLMEVKTLKNGCEAAFCLSQFKLRNKEELVDLFKLNDIPSELYRENYEEMVSEDVKT